MSQLDELTAQKHLYEQAGYSELRNALVQDFINDPNDFVKNHGKRPEDLQGADLRAYYRNFLVLQRPVCCKDDGFRRRFLSGGMF